MEIVIAAVGRFRAGPERELYNTYIQRLPWKVDLREVELRKKRSGGALKEAEAELLLTRIKGSDVLISLDERGKDYSSREFATLLGRLRDEGRRRIAFVIGGADGLSPSLRKQSHHCLSFGNMVWPHLLIRPMLAEQLFRAWSILENHPYHRD